MAVESQVCPKCGATIKFSKGQTEVVCAYCGATVVKSKASTAGAISIKKEIEAEKLTQEVIERELRLHTEGRPATAKILSAQKTDIYRLMLNGKGMLLLLTVEVLPDKEAPFNAETKSIVGLIAIDKYKPGTVLDVRYDPQDHTQVSVEGRHGVPGSNPWLPNKQERQAEEEWRKGDELMRQADEEWEKGEKEYQQGVEEMGEADEEWQQTDAEEAPTPAWGKPHAAGTVPVPARFDPVTNLGAPIAVYRHQGGLNLHTVLSGTEVKELVLYQDGIAFLMRGKEIHTWRWPEVATILTHKHSYPPSKGFSAYTSQTYTLLKGNGEKLILDDLLGGVEVEHLIQSIKDKVYARLYPPLKKQYGAGQDVTFGPVTVQRANGLTMRGKTYAWADIIDVKVDQGRLTVTMRDDHKHQVPTDGIPNVELLCKLIGVKLEPNQLCAV